MNTTKSHADERVSLKMTQKTSWVAALVLVRVLVLWEVVPICKLTCTNSNIVQESKPTGGSLLDKKKVKSETHSSTRGRVW